MSSICLVKYIGTLKKIHLFWNYKFIDIESVSSPAGSKNVLLWKSLQHFWVQL